MVEFFHKMQSLSHVRLGYLLNQIKLRNHQDISKASSAAVKMCWQLTIFSPYVVNVLPSTHGMEFMN